MKINQLVILFLSIISIPQVSESEGKDYFPLSLGYFWEYNAQMQRPSTMTMEVISCDTIDKVIKATIKNIVIDNQTNQVILNYNVDYEKIDGDVYWNKSLMYKLSGYQSESWEFINIDSTILIMELADTSISYYFKKTINECYLIKAKEKNGNDNFCNYTLAPDIGMVRASGDICLGLNLVKFGKLTGVEKKTMDDNSVSIFPNPASDYIEISLPPLPEGEGRGEGVKIFDILGTKITTPSLRDTPPYQEGEKVRIDVSEFVPGVYFIRSGNKVQKFIKY